MCYDLIINVLSEQEKMVKGFRPKPIRKKKTNRTTSGIKQMQPSTIQNNLSPSSVQTPKQLISQFQAMAQSEAHLRELSQHRQIEGFSGSLQQDVPAIGSGEVSFTNRFNNLQVLAAQQVEFLRQETGDSEMFRRLERRIPE